MRPSRSRWTVAVILVPALAAAQTPSWLPALGDYFSKPGGREARVLRRYVARANHPPPILLLALADAELRRGRREAARRLFQRVSDAKPGFPWSAWADLGLGGIHLRRGDVDAARPYFDRVAALGGDIGLFATMLLATGDAAEGRVAAALTAFRRVADHPEASAGVRTAARLWTGYAELWTGDYPAAAGSFDAVATADPDGPLADDARYAAAVARERAGAREAALADLHSLARDPAPPVAPKLVALEPSAVVSTVMRRYRRLPPRMPETLAVQLLDGDGGALARAALEETSAGAESARIADATPSAATRPTARGSRRERTASADASSRAAWLAGLGIVASALWFLRRRQRRRR